MKVLETFLELPALPIQPIYLKIGPNWPNRQCCLAKTARKFFIFSIAMDADYSFDAKSIAIYALTFLGYNNSVLAIVYRIHELSTYVICPTFTTSNFSLSNMQDPFTNTCSSVNNVPWQPHSQRLFFA